MSSRMDDNKSASMSLFFAAIHVQRRPIRIRVGSNRRGIHRHAISWSVRGYIAATPDDDRMHKMLVQVGCVLDHAVLQRAAYRDVVEEREMLHIFTQANASRVRADRDAELGGQKENRQDFVYPADAAGIDLADGNGVGLKKLLEDNAILHMFTGGNTDRRDRTCNRGMSKNIIRAGGLFNPEGVKCRQGVHC